MSDAHDHSGKIAIVGMACRFPGAPDLESYWDNLHKGVESISYFTEEELAHVDPALRVKPNFVGARGLIEDIDRFDAKLFGLTPMEATVANPSQRIMLEVALEALERAGYNPDAHGEGMGVFCGSDQNGYFEYLMADRERLANINNYQLIIGNQPDHLATRISYLLDLGGPSLSLYTACSTSLVTVHVACQHLIHYECDTALAGGACVPVPPKGGYLHEEGSTMSPDGRCRAFDIDSRGCGIGSGAGMVVLKRMEDALADGDHIHAVIRGSAINNDGANKVGYTAPSVEGQRRVLEEALEVAGVDPANVSYVETHGTGTTLGDPIEIEALRQAYEGAGHCYIGSVKTNIGHSNSAAGIASLIKVALCLENQTLVPSLNFTEPNPKLHLDHSPFQVCTETQKWNQPLLQAAVSSFGIGGTNAHALLEAAPPKPNSDNNTPHQHIVTLSAKSPRALTALRQRLHGHLESIPDDVSLLADWAYSLNVGRRALDHRWCFTFSHKEEALAALSKGGQPINTSGHVNRPVVFMFPGQGKQYPDLGTSLYAQEAVFRAEVDHCASILQPILGLNITDYLFAGEDSAERKRLVQADLWQPAIFVVEYALASLWISRGIEPEAMIGHSIGEYVCAVLAGVMRLEDGLALIAERGKQTAQLSEGVMAAVVAPSEKVAPFVRRPLALAAINGPSLCVISGPPAEMATLVEDLKAEKMQVIQLESTHAFHSPMMEPVAEHLTNLADRFDLHPPDIPYISNLTGDWISDEAAQNPEYWAQHLLAPVLFEMGLKHIFSDPARVCLEVGPGKVLAKLAERHPDNTVKPVASMDDTLASGPATIQAYADLWTRGIALDWENYYHGQRRNRVPLPTYPFEHQSFWLPAIDAPFGESSAQSNTESALDIKRKPENWFFLPIWRQAPRTTKGLVPRDNNCHLVFIHPGSECVADWLEERGHNVVRVRVGPAFEMIDAGNFMIDPEEPRGYAAMLDVLTSMEITPTHLIHGWSLDQEGVDDQHIISQGFDCLSHLTRVFGGVKRDEPVKVTVLSHGVFRITPRTPIVPAKATLLGSVWVIPKETANLDCRLIDLDSPLDSVDPDILLAELDGGPDATVALHHGARWVEDFTPMTADDEAPDVFAGNGSFLITNPWNEMGYALIKRLADSGNRIILADRAFFPEHEEWEDWIKEQGTNDLTSTRIRRLKPILEKGADLHIHTVNLTDRDAVKQLLTGLDDLSGVIHLDQPTESGLIQAKPINAQSKILRTKITEAENLLNGLRQSAHTPRHVVLCAENLGEGGIGKAEQGAAYYFLGSLAQAHGDALPVTTVEWGTFSWGSGDSGQAVSVIEAQLAVKRERFGMQPHECAEALAQLLTLKTTKVVVSTRDYMPLVEQQSMFTAAFFQNQLQDDDDKGGHGRPDLDSEYAPPSTQVETLITEIWENHFDIQGLGINDNFFALGGHSLLAVQLISKLNETFSTSIAMEHFFNAPTITELATIITEASLDEEEAAGLEAMLDEIEGLSEEEIQNLLDQT